MIMAERLDQGIPHRADIFLRLDELRASRKPSEAVKGPGKLVEVRADFTEMAEKPRQLPALDRWAADSAGARAAKRQSAQIGSDAKPCSSRGFVDGRAFFRGAANGDKTGLGVRDAFAASPRCRMFGTRARSLVHRSARLLRR